MCMHASSWLDGQISRLNKSTHSYLNRALVQGKQPVFRTAMLQEGISCHQEACFLKGHKHCSLRIPVAILIRMLSATALLLNSLSACMLEEIGGTPSGSADTYQAGMAGRDMIIHDKSCSFAEIGQTGPCIECISELRLWSLGLHVAY